MKKRSTTKYYTNDKVTIAKISNVKNIHDELEDIFGGWLTNSIENVFVGSGYQYKRHDERSYVGKSICDERDNFDESIGRKIASLKADKKYHLSMMKQYDALVLCLYKITLRIFENYLKHDSCFKKLENKLNEYNEVNINENNYE